MKAIKCPTCGSTLDLKDGFFACPRCRNKYYKTFLFDNPEFANKLNHALELIQKGDFDAGKEEFTTLISEYPNEPEVYLGRMYARYGISFPEKNQYQPTLFFLPDDCFSKDNDYLHAIKVAQDERSKRILEEKIKVLDSILTKYKEIKKNVPEYDIFLSYKRTELDDKNKLTKDTQHVKDLQLALLKKGYKVFMAPDDIPKGTDYEPWIYASLLKAKIMIVYGSNIDYFSDKWVKNEWLRFLKLSNTTDYQNNVEGAKIDGSLLVFYTPTVEPYDLPIGLKNIQGASVDSLEDSIKVYDAIDVIMAKYKNTKKAKKLKRVFIQAKEPAPVFKDENVKKIEIRTIGNFQTQEVEKVEELQKGNNLLTIGNYKNAYRIFSNYLINNPQNIEALIGKYLSSYKHSNFDAITPEEVFDEWHELAKLLNDAKDSVYEEVILSNMYNGIYNLSKSFTKNSYIKKLKEVLQLLFSYQHNLREKTMNAYYDIAIQNGYFEIIMLIQENKNFTSIEKIISYYKSSGSDFYKRQHWEQSILCYNQIIKYEPSNLFAIDKKIEIEIENQLSNNYFEQCIDMILEDLNIYFSYSSENQRVEILNKIIKQMIGKSSNYLSPSKINYLIKKMLVYYPEDLDLAPILFDLVTKNNYNYSNKDYFDSADLCRLVIDECNESQDNRKYDMILHISKLGLLYTSHNSNAITEVELTSNSNYLYYEESFMHWSYLENSIISTKQKELFIDYLNQFANIIKDVIENKADQTSTYNRNLYNSMYDLANDIIVSTSNKQKNHF